MVLPICSWERGVHGGTWSAWEREEHMEHFSQKF